MGGDAALFIKNIEEFGFERLLDIPFKDMHKKEDVTEHFYVYFHKTYGIFLQFDTYTWWNNPPGINGGTYYHQWRTSKEWAMKQEEKYGRCGTHPCLSSGNYLYKKKPCEIYNAIWHGSGDCRENMIG